MKWIHTLIFLFSIESTYAKRLAPAGVDPLPHEKGTIEQIILRNGHGMTVSLLARDKRGETKWRTEIYQVIYKKNMEKDVQDVHLKKIYLTGNEVIAIDELGKSYHLGIADGVMQN